MTEEKIVRIGGASGFWGDSMVGAPQLVNSGLIDYLVFDYLAETTMSILAAAHARKPEMGYATDFVDIAMKAVLPEVMRRGIRVVANAGGINPRGCADALRAVAESQGLSPRIAVVEGDDVATLMPQLREAGTRDMYTDEWLPENILSASAYLGAVPVARALDAGADIVITGRGVDSAVTLGPLIHHTDWESVPDWPNIGYPVIECSDDGSFIVTKPAGTGGIVLRAAIAEQMLYEIGDPGAYLLPDVSCDFRDVQMDQIANDRVRVSGARGHAPTNTYKVSATTRVGYRCAGTMVIIGIDAAAKAQRTGESVIVRTRSLLREAGLPDYTATSVELLGAESLYGPHARTQASREAMVRIVADHPDKQALAIFAREIAPAGTSWSPGTTSPGGGRPSASPLIKSFSFLLDKRAVEVGFILDGERTAVANPRANGTSPDNAHSPAAWTDPDEPTVEVPLVKLAWARSGDKGNLSNIGVIARRPEWFPLIWARVTPETVKEYFAHLVKGRVERFYLPGISAVNYVMHDALDGGIGTSTRMDPLGKGMGQMLLDIPVAVPRSLAAQL